MGDTRLGENWNIESPKMSTKPSTTPSWTNTSLLESNGVSVTLVTSEDGLHNRIGAENSSSSSNGVTILSSDGTPINPKRTPFPVAGPKAKCDLCNRVGLKNTFFTKNKNFCSLQCYRAAWKKGDNLTSTKTFQRMSDYSDDSCDNSSKFKMESTEERDDSSVCSSTYEERETVRSSSSASNIVTDEPVSDDVPVKKKKKRLESDTNYDWADVVESSKFNAADVNLFRHAPLARSWDNVIVGMKLEVENKDIERRGNQPAYWVASVLKIQGYKVKLRFEGFGEDCSEDFWTNLCSEDIHHVGWCANKGKPLIPPKSIANKYDDWRKFLVHRLTGARTLPHNFQAKVAGSLKSKNELDTELEVVDKNRISQLRVASVCKIVGKRLHVQYFDSEDIGSGFWCHEDSRLIHPKGWANAVGHEILAPPDYQPPPLPGSRSDNEFENLGLEVGMKLEAIDPLNLSAICAASIKKVLKRGYIMIRVDCYEDDGSGDDWFCYHISSPYVLHCGFCSENSIVLTPPNGYEKNTFTWNEYFDRTRTKAAPVPPKKQLDHGLEVGMALESADLMDPRLICPAKISRVVGRLLKIHFDGWDEEYDQWLDARSPDIYPVGWCELVDHVLEHPRAPQPARKSKKAKKKVGKSNKGPFKSKKNLKLKKEIRDTGTGGFTDTALSGSQAVDKSNLQLKYPAKRYVTATSHSVNDNVHMIARIEKDFEPCIVKTEHFQKNLPPSSQILFPTSIKNLSFDLSNVKSWNAQQVAQYLESNNCASYATRFSENNIDGSQLLTLDKDQIMILTGMKVGPALKIVNMISILKRNAELRSSK